MSNVTNRSINPWALTTRRVVFCAIFGALTLVLGGVGFGFIPLPNASGAGTVLHIPTILGAIIGGPIVGMFCGVIFGVLALVAFPVFGPFVHLPSRILIGLVAWAVYVVLRRRAPAALAAVVAAVAGSLTNTIVTVGTAVLLGLVTPAVALTFIPQAITELVAAAILTPIIVLAVESVPNAAAIDFGLTNIDIVVQAADGGRQYVTIPNSGDVVAAQVEQAIKASRHTLNEFDQIAVTGGQHRRLPARIHGVILHGVDEVTAIGRGGLAQAGLEQALVVSAGSGTAMVAARPDGVHHVTGSAVGGGTLQGLGKLLVGTADAMEIDVLAQQGDSNVVDLTLLEATGGVLGRLPADANAVNFGRIARFSREDMAWSPARKDVAAGLVLMIGQVIAVIAINAARAESLEQIVVVGHLVDLPSVRRVLATVSGYYAARISVPEMPGYATALGALLCEPNP